jgi:hypothetical protein
MTRTFSRSDDYHSLLYIMGQDQAHARAINQRITENCINKSKAAILRSEALLDRIRDREEAQARRSPPSLVPQVRR